MVVSHLSDTEKRLFALADNKIPELSTWDLPMLKLEIRELSHRYERTSPDRPDWSSSCHKPTAQRQRASQNWHSSLADLTPRIDPYSVVIGPARRSEFQSKLAGALEGLCRITRREGHGSGYVRKASASRGGKHR